MKKFIKSTILLLLSVLLVVSLVACGNTVKKEGLWESATYREDTELGEGAKTAIVEVKVEDEAVVFTIHTDKDTVGDALIEYELISGEEGAYGLYIKTVNGITADYDVDQSYWAFYIDGEYAMTGVDGTKIDESARYTLEYAK